MLELKPLFTEVNDSFTSTGLGLECMGESHHLNTGKHHLGDTCLTFLSVIGIVVGGTNNVVFF